MKNTRTTFTETKITLMTVLVKQKQISATNNCFWYTRFFGNKLINQNRSDNFYFLSSTDELNIQTTRSENYCN